MTFKNNILCRVGCAGWNVPKEIRTNTESYLEQYARTFNCTEIDSSFYRHHQKQTYEKWAATVPSDFKFSVKAPKLVTHSTEPSYETFEKFLDEISGLGEKLEIILLQFPPRKNFVPDEAAKLFKLIQKDFKKRTVCEPRHSSWFTKEAEALLSNFSIDRVIADPKATIEAPDIFLAKEGSYIRLHGKPKINYSEYSKAFLQQLMHLEEVQSKDTWVIFDNTGVGHAYRNASSLLELGFCSEQQSQRNEMKPF